jgi:plasmid stabilization system protein ParE
MVKKIRISWDTEARKHFRDAILFIKKDSVKNSQIVKEKVLESVRKLSIQPEKYPIDKYRKNNDGHYRAFEVFHFRVSYYFSESEIRIVRFRHTRMKTKKF